MDNVHIVVDLKKHAISLEFVGKVTNTKWNVKFLGMDAECLLEGRGLCDQKRQFLETIQHDVYLNTYLGDEWV